MAGGAIHGVVIIHHVDRAMQRVDMETFLYVMPTRRNVKNLEVHLSSQIPPLLTHFPFHKENRSDDPHMVIFPERLSSQYRLLCENERFCKFRTACFEVSCSCAGHSWRLRIIANCSNIHAKQTIRHLNPCVYELHHISKQLFELGSLRYYTSLNFCKRNWHWRRVL